jgi:hypothetical protein
VGAHERDENASHLAQHEHNGMLLLVVVGCCCFFDVFLFSFCGSVLSLLARLGHLLFRICCARHRATLPKLFLSPRLHESSGLIICVLVLLLLSFPTSRLTLFPTVQPLVTSCPTFKSTRVWLLLVCLEKAMWRRIFPTGHRLKVPSFCAE